MFGNKIKSFDAARVQNMPGVKKVVQVDDSAVAVVADSWWHAKKALDALPVTWEVTDNDKVSSASIADFIKSGLTADQAAANHKEGDALAAIKGAARTIEAVYSYPYQNHAPMEPMNTTALYTADRCEVWCPTQNGEAALAAVSEECGLPIAQCEVHKIHPRRRLRPPGPFGLCPSGRRDRQADAGHAGQAAVVARRRHDALPLSPGHAMQDDGRL